MEPGTEDEVEFSDGKTLSALDARYRTLFLEGGFEFLRQIDRSGLIDPGDIGEHDYRETRQFMAHHGLMQTGERSRPSRRGREVYENWSDFLDYLTSEERFEFLEQQIGENRMPEFLADWGIETDIESYLEDREKYREKWGRRHDETMELYNIAQVLYSGDQNEPGQGISDLQEAAEGGAIPPAYREVGIVGLVEDGELNPDGRKLYLTVRNDYLRNLEDP